MRTDDSCSIPCRSPIRLTFPTCGSKAKARSFAQFLTGTSHHMHLKTGMDEAFPPPMR